MHCNAPLAFCGLGNWHRSPMPRTGPEGCVLRHKERTKAMELTFMGYKWTLMNMVC